MYWEEKIDQIKSETSPNDFNVPFTEASAILKKIEDQFIIKENSNDRFSNWAGRLKAGQRIKEIKTAELEDELAKLDAEQNYWLILPGNNPTTKYLLYDSKPYVIVKLLKLRVGDFYLGDKKYNWLMHFH